MSTLGSIGPPTPPPSSGLDPLSETIGELKADVRAIRTDLLPRIDARLDRIEARLWWIVGIVLSGMLGMIAVALGHR